MAEQALIDAIRRELIEHFEKFLEEVKDVEIYRSSCLNVITKLKNREPIKLEGPIAGEPLDEILGRHGFLAKNEAYFELWKAIEDGK